MSAEGTERPKEGDPRLLVLLNQVPSIALRLSKLHFVHALPSVPMEECMALVHRNELMHGISAILVERVEDHVLETDCA